MKKKSLKKMVIIIIFLVLAIVGIVAFIFQTTITAGIEYYMHAEKYDDIAVYYAERYKTGNTEDIDEHHDGIWTCVDYDECGRMNILVKIGETNLDNESGDYRVLSLEYIDDEYSGQVQNTTKIPFADNWYSYVYIGPIG